MLGFTTGLLGRASVALCINTNLCLFLTKSLIALAIVALLCLCWIEHIVKLQLEFVAKLCQQLHSRNSSVGRALD